MTLWKCIALNFPLTIVINRWIISDLGVYVDGYAAVIGHTFVIGATKDNKVTGRKADVMLAAHHCAEAALRLIKPGRDVMD